MTSLIAPGEQRNRDGKLLLRWVESSGCAANYGRFLIRAHTNADSADLVIALANDLADSYNFTGANTNRVPQRAVTLTDANHSAAQHSNASSDAAMRGGYVQ